MSTSPIKLSPVLLGWLIGIGLLQILTVSVIYFQYQNAFTHLSSHVDSLYDILSDEQLEKLAIKFDNVAKQLSDDTGTLAILLEGEKVKAVEQALKQVLEVVNTPRQRYEHAMRAAENALQEENESLARLFYLNAYRADSSNITPLTKYADSILAEEPTLEDLNQLYTVLETASYEVSATHIPTVLTLLQRVVNQQQQVMTQLEKAVVPVDWQLAYQEVMNVVLDEVTQDTVHIRKYAEKLQNVVQLMNQQDSLPEKEYQTVHALLPEYSYFLQVSTLLDQADEQLDQLTKALNNKGSVVRLVYRLNAVENYLAQIFTQQHYPLKGTVLNARISNVIGQLEATRNSLEKQKDQPKLSMIQQMVQQTEAHNEKKTDVLLAALKMVTGLFSELTNKEMREQAQEHMEILQKKLAEIRREKRLNYNRWAVTQCHSAFKTYRELYIVTDATAVSLFKRHDLAKIDQSLLSPEVSKVYMEVLHKLMAEMSVSNVVWVEEQLAVGKKKTLEDF